jgi:hypothetical protein
MPASIGANFFIKKLPGDSQALLPDKGYHQKLQQDKGHQWLIYFYYFLIFKVLQPFFQ